MRAPLVCAASILVIATVAGIVDEGCGKSLPEPMAPGGDDAGVVMIDPRQACEVAAETVVLVGQSKGLTCQEIQAALETLTIGPSPCSTFFGDAGTGVYIHCP